MLSDDSIDRIDVLFDVAKLNDAALSLGDLSLLLSSGATPSELEEAFERYPTLKSKYQLRSGFVFERGGDAVVSNELEKRTLATRNITLASSLSSSLRRGSSMVIAVSGSTSYGSVKRSDDLDFFCVTREDSAWIFFTRALLLLRALRLASPKYSSASVSCVMDFRFAEIMFEREQDALFARDGLRAIVLDGSAAYTELLRRAQWMTKYFPQMYANRVGPTGQTIPRDRPSPFVRLLNRFLFATVGRYVRIRSELENRRLARTGNEGRAFVTVLGQDHCIFESSRYRQMRQIYAGMAAPAVGSSPRPSQ